MAVLDQGVVIELLTARALTAADPAFPLRVLGDPEPQDLVTHFRIAGLRFDDVMSDGPTDRADIANVVCDIDVVADVTGESSYRCSELASRVRAAMCRGGALVGDGHVVEPVGSSTAYDAYADHERQLVRATVSTSWRARREDGDALSTH